MFLFLLSVMETGLIFWYNAQWKKNRKCMWGKGRQFFTFIFSKLEYLAAFSTFVLVWSIILLGQLLKLKTKLPLSKIKGPPPNNSIYKGGCNINIWDRLRIAGGARLFFHLSEGGVRDFFYLPEGGSSIFLSTLFVTNLSCLTLFHCKDND